jgi:hypothetical protein
MRQLKSDSIYIKGYIQWHLKMKNLFRVLLKQISLRKIKNNFFTSFIHRSWLIVIIKNDYISTTVEIRNSSNRKYRLRRLLFTGRVLQVGPGSGQACSQEFSKGGALQLKNIWLSEFCFLAVYYSPGTFSARRMYQHPTWLRPRSGSKKVEPDDLYWQLNSHRSFSV